MSSLCLTVVSPSFITLNINLNFNANEMCAWTPSPGLAAYRNTMVVCVHSQTAAEVNRTANRIFCPSARARARARARRPAPLPPPRNKSRRFISNRTNLRAGKEGEADRQTGRMPATHTPTRTHTHTYTHKKYSHRRLPLPFTLLTI